MRLGHLELFCKDCAATQAFYVDVLEFEETEVQGGQFVWLRSDGIEVLLRPTTGFQAAPSYSKSRQAMVMYVDDLIEFQSRLEERGIPLGEPDGSPDCLTLQDPDGRWIQVVEH